jgi:hypothetical protein
MLFHGRQIISGEGMRIREWSPHDTPTDAIYTQVRLAQDEQGVNNAFRLELRPVMTLQ